MNDLDSSAEIFTADQGHNAGIHSTRLESLYLKLLGKATSTGQQLLLSVPLAMLTW